MYIFIVFVYLIWKKIILVGRPKKILDMIWDTYSAIHLIIVDIELLGYPRS